MTDVTSLMKMISAEVSSQMKIRSAAAGFGHEKASAAKTAIKEECSAEETDDTKENTVEEVIAEKTDTPEMAQNASFEKADWKAMIFEPGHLRQAVIWSEVLGEPVARKRRKERKQARRGY